MESLRALDTAYRLPEASADLCEGLRRWSQALERLFRFRSSHRTTTQSAAKARKLKTGENEGRRRTNNAGEIRQKGNRLQEADQPSGRSINEQKWSSFSDACDKLFKNLHSFFSEIDRLSGTRDTWCKPAVAQLMVTLTVRSNNY